MFIPTRNKETELDRRKRLQGQRIERLAVLKAAGQDSEARDLEAQIEFWGYVIRDCENGMVM